MDTIETLIEERSQAPRVTLDQVEKEILREWYFTAADGVMGNGPHAFTFVATDPESLLTFCVLVLKNGYTVTGESACASPENFNADIGREIARRNAVAKVWPLLGYELRTRLHESLND